MRPATWPRAAPLDERLLVLDPKKQTLADAHVRDLPRTYARATWWS